ncbi:MAG: methylated-DNA--[protein]-cysteine S-methyltransferase [Syntrophomonadaceae bacterium]|nr:methylated-DNA--[protein]-cysteine S-methyltransferase [Syntrophomonadaceae bacterium]
MSLEYCVFETDWGFVGLVGNNRRVSSLILPLPEPTLVIQNINQVWGGKQIENSRLLTRLQEQVKAYFAGHRIEQWDCEPDLDGCSHFTRRVLLAAALIPYGTVQTYGMLARQAGCCQGARAVGQALKRNPLPLIIPCHRVVAAVGLGGFTAPGALHTKKALLKLEGSLNRLEQQ